ncbi:MAG: hypothetical protein RLZZ200_1963 [Pseudomonadota bacterium]
MNNRNPILRLLPGATVVLLVGGFAGFGIARWMKPASHVASGSAGQTRAPTDAVVNVSDASLGLMGIATEPVRRGNLPAEIVAPGAVVAAPDGQAIVSARESGTVTKLARRLGDAVRAGEVLALVESREAAALAAERATAESRVEFARAALAREQQLNDQKITPRQDLEAAQLQFASATAEVNRARAAAKAAGLADDGHSVALVSPIAGRITAAQAALGAYVEPSMELFRVADPSRAVVQAALSANDSRRVKIGDAGRITTASGARIDAVVTSVTPTLSDQSRTATATLALKAPGPVPGEFVQVRILPGGVAADSIVLPEESVQRLDGRDVVFVRTAEGFRPTAVTLGARSDGQVAVLSGLAPEAVVATTNAFLLKAEIAKAAEEEE